MPSLTRPLPAAELYFPLLRTRFEVPDKQSADHERILQLIKARGQGEGGRVVVKPGQARQVPGHAREVVRPSSQVDVFSCARASTPNSSSCPIIPCRNATPSLMPRPPTPPPLPSSLAHSRCASFCSIGRLACAQAACLGTVCLAGRQHQQAPSAPRLAPPYRNSPMTRLLHTYLATACRPALSSSGSCAWSTTARRRW